MVAWSIYLSTLGHVLNHDFFIRLTPLLAFSSTGLLLYREIRDQFSRSQAMLFITLFSTSIYLQYIAGMMILPDAPLLFFSGLFFFSLLRWNRNTANSMWLVVAGLMVGLCTWSKYQSLLWPLVFTSTLFLFYRKNSKGLLVFLLASAVFILPLLYFNFYLSSDQMGYHGQRFDFSSIKPLRLLSAMAGEVLYMNPAVFFIISRALWSPWKMNSLNYTLLGCSIPIIIMAWCLSLFNPILPHWTGPAYLPLILFTAINTQIYPVFKLLRRTVLFMVIFSALALTEIHHGYFLNDLSLGEPLTERGKKDGTLDLYGWHQLSKKIKHHDLEKRALIIPHWYPGSHYLKYISSPEKVYPVGTPSALHEWTYHPNYRKELPEGSLFIESSRYPRLCRSMLDTAYYWNELEHIPIIRDGDTVMNYRVMEVFLMEGVE